MDLTNLEVKLSGVSSADLLAELERRNQKTEDVDHIIVFGTTCIHGKDDVIEVFQKVVTPEDVPNMFVLGMRSRMNLGRQYRQFYFKTTVEDFAKLEQALNQDNVALTKTLLTSPNVTIKDI